MSDSGHAIGWVTGMTSLCVFHHVAWWLCLLHMAAAVFKNVFKPQCMNTFEFPWCHICYCSTDWASHMTVASGSKGEDACGHREARPHWGLLLNKLLRMRPPRPRRIPGDSADTSTGCVEWLPGLGWRKTGRLKSLILRNKTHNLEEWVGINQPLRSHQPSWGKSC